MEGALIILAITVTTGIVLYIWHKISEKKINKTGQPTQEPQPQESKCCGMHITCEKDSLLAGVSSKIEYYDDEELDAYKGKASADYTDEEIEQFRDILLTLLPEDIAGWARSLQLRGIKLPDAVREELLMLVREEREKREV